LVVLLSSSAGTTHNSPRRSTHRPLNLASTNGPSPLNGAETIPSRSIRRAKSNGEYGQSRVAAVPEARPLPRSSKELGQGGSVWRHTTPHGIAPSIGHIHTVPYHSSSRFAHVNWDWGLERPLTIDSRPIPITHRRPRADQRHARPSHSRYCFFVLVGVVKGPTQISPTLNDHARPHTHSAGPFDPSKELDPIASLHHTAAGRFGAARGCHSGISTGIGIPRGTSDLSKAVCRIAINRSEDGLRGEQVDASTAAPTATATTCAPATNIFGSLEGD
jgi:hypothetical protein